MAVTSKDVLDEVMQVKTAVAELKTTLIAKHAEQLAAKDMQHTAEINDLVSQHDAAMAEIKTALDELQAAIPVEATPIP